jgi:hypothetical protein
VKQEKTAIIIWQPATRILITDTSRIFIDIVYPNNAVIILSGSKQANFEGFLHFGTSLIEVKQTK